MLLTLDGESIFGFPLECRMLLNPSARQTSAFFGISGVQSVFGGSRGRVFQVRGLFYGPTPFDCDLAVNNLETFADGRARVLTKTYSDGSSSFWPNVVYMNEYQPEGAPLLQAGDSGTWVQAYRLQLHGLT